MHDLKFHIVFVTKRKVGGLTKWSRGEKTASHVINCVLSHHPPIQYLRRGTDKNELWRDKVKGGHGSRELKDVLKAIVLFVIFFYTGNHFIRVSPAVLLQQTYNVVNEIKTKKEKRLISKSTCSLSITLAHKFYHLYPYNCFKHAISISVKSFAFFFL